jgi:hypothetical protein
VLIDTQHLLLAPKEGVAQDFPLHVSTSLFDPDAGLLDDLIVAGGVAAAHAVDERR